MGISFVDTDLRRWLELLEIPPQSSDCIPNQSTLLNTRRTEKKIMCEPQECGYASLPKSSTEWTKETLDLLNAKFDSHSVAEFTFPELELPEHLQNGIIDSIGHRMLMSVIDKTTEELADFNNSEPLVTDFDLKKVDFCGFILISRGCSLTNSPIVLQ